ncbi:MAG: RNA polymerase sigma factor [Deltaproteobacteria bacterium]|nr:RNA polymerase sigma factor [Deltaproteobacteria bacterium]MBN2671759.1 RNA polymerase sigma factor [Deltaproteobacteria bacterium]
MNYVVPMNDDKQKIEYQTKKEGRSRCPDFAEIIRTSTPDDSLFIQIANCFSQRLSDFAVAYCRDDTLGKDAFQEAMLTAFSKLDTYRGEAPIEPWLRRIVVTSCSRLRRGKKNDPNINASFDAGGGDSAFKADDPSQEWSLMMAQSFHQVLDEVEQLGEPNRSLLLDHDMHEEPIVSLAERYNMSVDAVKSRLKRSRAQLRESLLAKAG